ncbi:anti-sigma-28 factor FlgM [Caballeronia udeis]|uniref:Negative regulator of flagellin synthesis n=1 Tax=Caballeronia udeis TaxID=1232866 RepID=A0A158G9E4_9BURK|nr:anti-sigma-28 factor FlgM [Caballeronia udeis]
MVRAAGRLKFLRRSADKGITSSGKTIVKIDSSNTSQIAALQEAAQQRTAQADAQATSTTGGTTTSSGSNSTVSLSALSTDLRTSGSSSDIDTAKVASIKASLNDGSYKVDSGKVADGMLSSARELMQTNTPPAGG